MNYSDEPSMVRVDFFEESGKWYTTEAVKWLGYEGYIFDEFILSLRNHLIKNGQTRLSGMTAVCLDPYNKNSFPLMYKNWDKQKLMRERI